MTSAAVLLGGCYGVPVTNVADIRKRWPAQGRLVRAAGVDIHAWEQGSGTPVVLIHGASGNLRDWTWDLGPTIAKRRRAIAFDRPGAGYSGRAEPNGGDPAVQARALMAAARELGVERPIVVGHSWGAAVALSWALQDPDNVAGVVTVSGTVMPWSEKPMLAEMIGLDKMLIGAYFNYVQASALDDGVDRFVKRIFRPQEPPKGYIDHVGGPLALQTDTLEANKADIRTLNTALRRMAPDYGKLTMPVEVISGTRDFIINPDRQPIPFAARVPKARLNLLDGIGHMAHHARPEVLMAALDRLDPGSA